MKPRLFQLLPRLIVFPVMPLIGSVASVAAPVIQNESNSSHVWILPEGVNLLAGAAPLTAAATHEGSSNIWGTLTDGNVGTLASNATSVTPNNRDVVTFALDLAAKPGGYDITSFDSYSAWGDSGRDNQDYTLQYSTVAEPEKFVTITAVNHRTGVDRSTHTRITDNTGYLARGVHSVRVIFAHNQENGYTGFREFVLLDKPVVTCVSTEANNQNAFFIPRGPNLLAGVVPVGAAPAVYEGSTGSWATLTDGSLGDYTSPATSCTPGNGQVVTYPLDLSAKPGGYDITSFDSFCAWGSNGRDDQNYTLSYSTVAAPDAFVPITTVVAHTEFNGPNARRATHARVTGNGRPLATGVHSVRVTFHNQENGYTGFREFFLSDQPIVRTTHESNQTHQWTLPSGVNLLAGAVADPSFVANSDHGNGDVTSSTWGVLTDGSVGAAGVQTQSVAPLDNTSVVYTLDTTVNTRGYNLTSFDAYAAWGDTGRDNQDFTVLYATVDDPGVFWPIETIANHTNYPLNATHSRVVAAGGYLAANVGAVKFHFNNQENGYVGYREFVVQGNAVPLFGSLTWAGGSGSGGMASWVGTPDGNWKDGGVVSPFNSLAPLTFDDSGANTAIGLPAAITAANLTFANSPARPYSFGGEALTVSNSVEVNGTGSVVFNNPLQAPQVAVNGSGSLTLAVNNPLGGTVTVANGILEVASDAALGTASLGVTGGKVAFKSPSPVVSALAGTGGTLVLGNAGVAGGRTTLQVANAASAVYAGSITDASASSIGSLVKTGAGSLTLGGVNAYTGRTTVSEGELKLVRRDALYGGNAAQWTASNLLVDGVLTLQLGGAGEFTGADVALLGTGGFAEGAVLGLDTSGGAVEVTEPIVGDVRIRKEGLNELTLSGSNTFKGGITVAQGVLNLANPEGISVPGDLTVGNVTFDAFANLGFNDQFGPESLWRFETGPGAVNGKLQLRGTNQTVAGLVSGGANRVAIIQNDEVGVPGYQGNPAGCTLTVNPAEGTVHSFRGIIRNQDGGPVSLVKNGLGTQELVNTPAQSNGYSGPTTINAGTLRIAFAGGAGSGFGSDIEIAEAGLLHFRATAGNYAFGRAISGTGKVWVDGGNAVILQNGGNAWSGGTTVDGGFLALSPATPTGEGVTPGDRCVAGLMDPRNVIRVINGGTLSIDGTAALGNSLLVPENAPSLYIGEGSRIYGGTGTVAFVSNLTLDGGRIEITDGAGTGGFNTDLAFVGTFVVGGESTVPSVIVTVGSGPNANATLGSLGAPGTTFQVAEVTGDEAVDFTVASVLRDVQAVPSPLVKTGAGTLSLEGVNTYTGDTTVTGGVLAVHGSSIADGNKVVMNGGRLRLADGVNETVGSLYYGGSQQVAGTYGSSASAATFKDDLRFAGTGVLTVAAGPMVTDPYMAWAAVIPDQGQRGRGDDPDGDGHNNLKEYLFGGSPVEKNGSFVRQERVGANLVVRWNQREGVGTYVLHESAALGGEAWPVSSAVVVDDPVQGLPGHVRKMATVPVEAGRKFLRVEATE